MKCGSQPADISLINRRYRRFPNKKAPGKTPGQRMRLDPPFHISSQS